MSSQVDELANDNGPTPIVSQPNHPDVIKIMITTDNHVGYMENDPVRGQDAINSFREALQIAKEEEVDMILLGGDLFHENKPSRNTLHQVMAALREHTLGDKPVPLELISDPYDNALGNYTFPAVNYEDGNFNVAIPVFSIHGNHDDPQGLGPDGALSAIDILSTAGLINYFGKTNIVIGSDKSVGGGGANGAAAGSTTVRGTQAGDRDIKIRPVLLRKGLTKLALYGLGNLHDERLAMELRMRRVRMYQPAEDRDEFFHMLALHQNRVNHNPKAVVPEGIFDDSLHLLIWGHEHEERADPEPVHDKPYRICQPGSTVVTALSKGEDKPKCVVILKIHGQDYEVVKRELKTVRPFIIEDLDLEEELAERNIQRTDNDKSKYEVNRMLEQKILGLVDRAREQWRERHAELPDEDVPPMPLPLVRLRVDYEKQEVGNLARFGQKFVGQVANPKELLGFNKKRAAARRARDPHATEFVEVDIDDLGDGDLAVAERLQKLDLGKIVGEVIRGQDLECLSGGMLDEAVLQFVEKDSRTSVADAVKAALSRQLKEALPKVRDPKDIDDAIREAHEAEAEREERLHGRAGAKGKGKAAAEDTAPKGKGKGKAAAKGKGRAADDEEDSDEEMQILSMGEEEEDEDEAEFSDESLFRKPTSNAKGKRRAADSPPAKRPPAKKAAATKTSRAAKGKPTFRGGSEESEEDEFGEVQEVEDSEGEDRASMPPPPVPKPSGRAAALSQVGKKVPAKRGAAAATTAKEPAAKKRAPASRTTSSGTSAPSSATATPAARAGRRTAAKKAVAKTSKMVQSQADEDDDDDVDEYDD